MNIIVLDKDMMPLGSVSTLSTLIWTRRYYEYGMYELHTSSDYFTLLNQGSFIYRNDRDQIGLIEDVEYAQDEKGGRTCFAKGYFAEKLLERRVIPKSINISGTPEEIGRELVNTLAINPEDKDRVIPHVILGQKKGIGTSVRLQETGANLSEKLYSLEGTQEMSHKMVYDYLDNTLAYEVWKGLDRTEDQEENSPATFSNSFSNIKNAIYERDESTYANFAYVAGEGEGENRTVVEVDARSDKSEERIEIYVDARDLQSESSSGKKMTEEEYKEALYQRGLEKLGEYEKIEVLNSNIDPLANLEYMKDFDLGDLCTYVDTNVGLEMNERITEVQEIYEKGKRTLNITFGNDEATSITKIIKREAS